ncbi:hypothetical protein M407DRAFT_242454 [Tulasnella calospora MUT 4182]|uniref:UBX domain-containing protein n=1 Tax=Tulasnella calospora MUT 4182 TaxID=1051891 RepID=A0A0C3QF55_9AGAM|nr:hypothetical protein M407DRAFT_242454 [Tulasnella calospora MUT 4182]
MSDREQLLSFGFPEDRVTWALKSTGNRGLQAALDFLVENEDKPVPSDLGAVTEQKPPASAAAGTGDADDDDAAALQAALGMSMGITGAAEGSTGGEGGSSGGNVQSIKCSICGKIFRDTALANFHAEKSGHDQFEESTEEIKPLTEEEKKERLAELRQRALEKKAVKSVQEAEEAKANEKIRRKAGQDRLEAVEQMKVKELEREAAKKRQEKIDDAKAKAAIKAQIEADKRERAEKAAREKALREGRDYVPGQSSTPTPAATSQPAASASTVKGSEYKDTRLQIRLSAGGAPLITTLPSDSPLSAVAEFVAGQSLAYNVDTVSFTMQFPRKTFTQADMKKSLRDLGLTPSAVLIAS